MIRFADSEHWDMLSESTPYTMPAWDETCMPVAARIWIDRLSSMTEWRLATGFRHPQEFIQRNPEWPLRAFIGLLLEIRNS